jgi:uncharacterized protein (TIGR00369 family)
MEQARALMRGTMPRPPLSHLVGYRLTQVGSGSATMTMPASRWLLQFGGLVEMRVLVEEALAAAVVTGVPAGHEVRTVSLSINHLRPCTVEAETLVARARTVNTGPTYTLAEVLVEDGEGRSVVHATGSFLIRPLIPPPPPLREPLEPGEEPTYRVPDPHLRPPPDPTFPFHLFDEMDALAVCRLMLAGDLPMAPMPQLFGFHLVDLSEGAMAWELNTSAWLCSRSPEVAPGVVAILVSYGLTGAVTTLAPAGQSIGIVDQSIDFLRPAPADGRPLLARGRMVHEGDLLISAAEMTDAEGNRLAVGHQASVLVARRRRAPAAREAERVLATVLFTDIVESTRRAGELGDTRWQGLLDEHHSLVRRQIELYKGREVKTLGDGFLATFDAPARAAQCARAIRDGVGRLGLEIRAGLHTGECEVSGSDITGIAVHVASRVLGLAEPGEILATNTIRELVAGSGLRFADRGRHGLKGVEGEWQIYVLVD